MFRKIFGLKETSKPDGYDEGWKLFELGMAHASRYECESALDYYARSIAACKNPAPYINRANILCKRLRYYEALQDLLKAKKLDKVQSNEFSDVLRQEITKVDIATQFYRNGLREKLLDDLKCNGEDYVVGKIYCAAFGFNHEAWEARLVPPPFADYHFFNELDNVRKFDRLEYYPEVEKYLEVYPEIFVDEKVSNCPDVNTYTIGELKLHSFLCIYDQRTMTRLRRILIYQLHERLIDSDYPAVLGSLSDSRPTITRDAHRYIYGEDGI